MLLEHKCAFQINTNTHVDPMNVRRSEKLGQVPCYSMLNGYYIF